MKTLLVVLLCATTAGCGRGLDLGFDGNWTGTLLFTVGSGSSQMAGSSTETFAIYVAQDMATVSGVCPDGGGGHLAFSGAGDVASWSGVLGCAITVSGCSDTSIVYSDGTLSLETGPRVAININGETAGCGTPQPILFQFDGSP
jgi:hypothetical protein